MNKKMFICLFASLLLCGCENIKTKDVKVQAGTKLSTNINDYVVNGNEKMELDLNNVNINKVGKYEYYVKSKSKIIKGYVNVVDTYPPITRVTDIYIPVGAKPRLEKAVYYYQDFSPLKEVKSTGFFDEKKLSIPGVYNENIMTIDTYDNIAFDKIKIHVLNVASIDYESDLTPYLMDSKYYNLNLNTLYENTYLKFDKAIDTNDPKSLLSINEKQIQDYAQKKFAGYENIGHEVIGIYNKYNYLVAITIRISSEKDGNAYISYLSKETVI